MELHILDLTMYFLILAIFFRDFTNDDGPEGFIVFALYTIIYIVFFVIIDYNWIDIFKYLINNVTL